MWKSRGFVLWNLLIACGLSGCFTHPAFEKRVYEAKDTDTGKIVVYLETFSERGKQYPGSPTIVLTNDSSGERYSVDVSDADPSRWRVYKHASDGEVRRIMIVEVYRGHDRATGSHSSIP